MAGLVSNGQEFFDPYSPNSGTNSNLPGFVGIPRIPGESLEQYRARLMKAQQPYQQANVERKLVDQLSASQEAKSRAILGEQSGLQKTRLQELAQLLAQQQDTTFNQDIPGIAETNQAQGFLETSGFGNALANRYRDLTANTSAEIAKQGLADRDLQIKGLGEIGTNANSLSTAGLERQFSVTDNARSEELARELAKYGVPAPAKEPSGFDKALQYAGPVLSGVGAVKGAA